jgi:hypothetical protein
MVGAGGTADALDGVAAGVAGGAAAGACGGDAEALREAGLLGAVAAGGAGVAVAAGDGAGRNFGAAAARALAQLARLGASSFGAAVSAFDIVAVEVGFWAAGIAAGSG